MRKRLLRPLRIGLVVVGIAVVGWLALTSDVATRDEPLSSDGRAPSPAPRLEGRADPSADAEPSDPPAPPTGVFGRVVTDRGFPIPNATLDGHPRGRTRAGSDGRFCLRASVTRLRASALGYEPRHLELAPGAVGVQDVGDVVLRPSGVITVRVLFEDDRPVVGARVDWSFPRPDHEILNPRRNPPHAEWTWHPLGRTDDTGTRSGAVPGERVLAFRARVDGVPILSKPERPQPHGAVVLRVPLLHELRVVARFTATDRPITPVALTRLDGPPHQRWRRTLENAAGVVVVALPAGAYEVSALAAGRRRLSRKVEVPRASEVRLELEGVQRLEVRAKGRGTFLDEFLVQTRRGGLPPGLAASLLYGTTPVKAVDGVALLEEPFGEEAAAPDQLWVLVAAPGWRIHQGQIPWNARVQEHQVVVELAGAATVYGRLPGALRDAIEARLYARSVDGAGRWDAIFAPRVSVDEELVDGAFRLSTVGPGLYELRVFTGGRELLAGTCRVEDADVEMTTFDAPATLILELDGAAAQGAPPLLYRKLELSGWSAGVAHEPTALAGTRIGPELRFEDLQAGEYTLVRSDASIAPGRLAQAGEGISLASGETLRRAWAPAGIMREVRATVHLPEALAGRGASVAFVARADTPCLLPSLTWVDVMDGGGAELATTASGSGFVVVADTAGLGADTPMLFAVPLAVAEVGAADTSTEIRVAQPARVRVGGEADSRIVLIHEQLGAILGFTVFLAPDESSPPLLPGRWRIEWHHAYGGRLRTQDVDLAPGEMRTIPPP